MGLLGSIVRWKEAGVALGGGGRDAGGGDPPTETLGALFGGGGDGGLAGGVLAGGGRISVAAEPAGEIERRIGSQYWGGAGVAAAGRSHPGASSWGPLASGFVEARAPIDGLDAIAAAVDRDWRDWRDWRDRRDRRDEHDEHEPPWQP